MPGARDVPVTVRRPFAVEIDALLGSEVADPDDVQRALAKAVLTIASAAGMPDTYWRTDRRVRLACRALGLTPAAARRRAERWQSELDVRGEGGSGG